MVPDAKARRGPKGLDPEVHNRIVDYANSDVPAAKAIELTGVSTTKVYEIYRNRVKKPVPENEAA